MRKGIENIIDFSYNFVEIFKNHEFDIEIAWYVVAGMLKTIALVTIGLIMFTIFFLFKNADTLNYQGEKKMMTPIERRQAELEEEKQKEIDAWLDEHMAPKPLKERVKND